MANLPAFAMLDQIPAASGIPPRVTISESWYNTFAFHAVALDEQREAFEPTFWTVTTPNGGPAPSARTLDEVEQRWFVGAHANVGGGYPSDLLAQPPRGGLWTRRRCMGWRSARTS